MTISPLKPRSLDRLVSILSIGIAFWSMVSGAAEIPVGLEGFKSHVGPFFKDHCIKCHGPDKSKGKITVHSLDGDLAVGQELERWEDILDALAHEDMPPGGRGPAECRADRAAVVKWIESGLRGLCEESKSKEADGDDDAAD